MKIEINARDLQNMLKTAKGLELRKLDRDVQKSLLIKNDKLIMNNINTQLESEFRIDVIEPGETLIPESTLKMLEHFKSDSLIITDDTITHGTKELKFMPGPMENFITLDDKLFWDLFEVTESELNHLLDVNYATTNVEVRPELQGIEVKNNQFIALNGYYLSVREGNFNCNERILISQKVWKVLRKTLNKKSDRIVKVSWDKDKLVKFKFEDFIIKGELYKEHLLDVDKIIRDYHSTKIILEANKLIESLKLMDKLTKNEQMVLLSFTNDKLKIKTKTDMNIMSDEIEISKTGEDVQITFNIKYLLAVINQYKDEEVSIRLNGRLDPMILKNDNKLDLILPVRLPDDYEW